MLFHIKGNKRWAHTRHPQGVGTSTQTKDKKVRKSAEKTRKGRGRGERKLDDSLVIYLAESSTFINILFLKIKKIERG
jgi:hypothetical protein